MVVETVLMQLFNHRTLLTDPLHGVLPIPVETVTEVSFIGTRFWSSPPSKETHKIAQIHPPHPERSPKIYVPENTTSQITFCMCTLTENTHF